MHSDAELRDETFDAGGIIPGRLDCMFCTKKNNIDVDELPPFDRRKADVFAVSSFCDNVSTSKCAHHAPPPARAMQGKGRVVLSSKPSMFQNKRS